MSLHAVCVCVRVRVCPCRVGNLLGEGLHRTARKAGWLCVAIGGAFMAVCALLIGVLHDHIGKIFTSDPEVLAIAASLWPMVVLFQVSSVAPVCSNQQPGTDEKLAAARAAGCVRVQLHAAWLLTGAFGGYCAVGAACVRGGDEQGLGGDTL